MPRLVAALQNYKDEGSSQKDKELENAKSEAALAKREVEEGFPILFEQATISLWAALDSTLLTFLSRWLQHNPKCYSCQCVKKIKVHVSEYEKLTKYEKSLCIIELLLRELSMSIKHSIKRHEEILKQFGLGWDIDPEVLRELIELNVMRNYFVHRKGIVDGNLKKSCPWLNITKGQKITITKEKFYRFDTAVVVYALSVIVRLGEYYGKDMKKFADACKMPTETSSAKS